MNSEYLISVIIPTYNRGFIIHEAIESVLNQGISNIQIIIIDDGSTDNTKEVLSKYIERITYIYQENQGQSVARNVGLTLALGKYISFLDSDDIFVEDAFKKQLSSFKKFPEVETIISDAKFWLLEQHSDRSGLHPKLKLYPYPTLLSDFPAYWHYGLITATSCHIFKRDVLNNITPPFFDPSLPTWEDWDFFAKIYHHSNTLVIRDITANVRRFDDNTRKERHIPGVECNIDQEIFMHTYRDIVTKKVAKMTGITYKKNSNTEIAISKKYHQNGYYAPINVLSDDELNYYRKAFQNQKILLKDQIEHNRLVQLHLHFAWAYKLVTHPVILQYLEPILGPNILVHGSTLFYKKPNNKKSVLWHQDGYFMKFSSPKYVTAWVAFEDSVQENGCLQVIPGSQDRLYAHDSTPSENSVLPSGLTVIEKFNKEKAVDIELKAGEMSLHHVNIIHGSNPNISDKPRIGFAIRYIAAEVTQELYHHDVVIAKGTYNGNHYTVLEEPPKYDNHISVESQKKAHFEYSQKRNAHQV
ncbi:glycosyltransferase [Aquimarina sp. 2201CG14-23]|uniref:glycosyltransferase n=1 Tax=Aquimarina mycalae TaxID=3040073 RepID=UPI00247801AA|nr:glycosyltransferase [Aquimarina sp. 2201CG14-23]MDH7448109.1 glycosyltransferase [Aquimarina sp. 2201CG14-23]